MVFEYFMWFSQDLEAGTKYTLTVLPAFTYTVTTPSVIAIEGLTINELDSNIDYLKRSKGLSVGYFQLSTVSSYLPNYMTYDENPMFA